MKNPKFQVGHIVVKESNGFRRKIRDWHLAGNKIVYTYYDEELDEKYHATG